MCSNYSSGFFLTVNLTLTRTPLSSSPQPNHLLFHPPAPISNFLPHLNSSPIDHTPSSFPARPLPPKTSLSASLAVKLAMEGHCVLVVSTDPAKHRTPFNPTLPLTGIDWNIALINPPSPCGSFLNKLPNTEEICASKLFF